MNRAAFPPAILAGNGKEQVHSDNVAEQQSSSTGVDYTAWVKRSCTLTVSADDTNLREQQLMLRWAEPLFRLQEWLTETSWSSVKINPRSCPCDWVTLFIRTRWGEQLCRKVPEDADGKHTEHESAAHLCSKGVIGKHIPLPEAGTGQPRGNSHKLQENKLQLDARGKFLAGRVVQWTGCPRGCGVSIPWRHVKHSWTRPWGTWSDLKVGPALKNSVSP